MTTLDLSYYAADESEPVMELSVGELLHRRADESPDTVAIIEIAAPGQPSLTGAERTDRTWTYAELRDDAVHCARWLLTHFSPGDRVTVWAPNIPEWVVLQYGAALAGLVLVTANPALRTDELRYVLAQSRSAGLFHTDLFRGTDMTSMAHAAVAGIDADIKTFSFSGWNDTIGSVADAAPVDLPVVDPGGPAQIQYTSGTTGTPKGALLHHRGLVTNARFVALRGGVDEGGTLISAMPLFHTAGCAMSVLGSAQMGLTYGLVQQFDPNVVLRALQDLRGDIIFGVPTMFIAMLNDPEFEAFDFDRCRVAMSGGASVPPELVRRVEASFGCKFSTVYGQTELSPIVTQTSPHDSVDDKTHTVGRPLPQVEVKIADTATQNPVPIGDQGEICARGYQRMLEYFDMPEATRQTIDAEGWLHTGDLGTMDARGYVAVTGRLKDMIIRGGENIYPREIEELLFTHPAVEDVAVVGVPDDVWGEQVAAVLRVREHAQTVTVNDLRTFCRAALAPHKTPAYWYVTGDFPLTGSGKIQKFRIVEGLANGEYRTLTEQE